MTLTTLDPIRLYCTSGANNWQLFAEVALAQALRPAMVQVQRSVQKKNCLAKLQSVHPVFELV
eukprot:12401121-Karenia_brevis.AAC.1